MSDKKLYQLPALTPGGGDLVYIARPDGSADGSASFTALSPVLAGVLAPAFAPVSHSHAYGDLSGLPTLFSGAYGDLTGKPTLGSLAALNTVNNGNWSGTALAIGNGGTGAASAGAARTALGLAIGADVQGFNARLAEIAAASWAQGDILYFNGSSLVRMAAGTSGQVLQTNGAGANPSWATPSGGGGGGAATIVEPQGRLTLTGGVAVMTADATAQSTVYYVPYRGKFAPVYDGSAWAMASFGTGLSMSLDASNQLAETCYDLFIWNNSGTIAIGAGPAWITASAITVTIATPAVVSWTAHGLVEGDPVVLTTSGALPTGITAGTTYYVARSPGANSFNLATSRANGAAGTFVATNGSQSGVHTATNGTRARGSGAGTTELELKDGLWTNKNSITLKNGAGGGVSGIAANRATYLGTIYCTGNGQTGMAFKPAGASGGSNNVLGVWNAYNRVRVSSHNQDTNTSWTTTSTASHPKDSAATGGGMNNRITYVDGLAQSSVKGIQVLLCNQSTNGSGVGHGLVLDSTVATPSVYAFHFNSGISSTTAIDNWGAALGLHYVQAVERVNANIGTYYGATSAQTDDLAIELDM